jgi:type III pantothenate kinase
MIGEGLVAVDIGNSAIKLGWYSSAAVPVESTDSVAGFLPQPQWTEQYATADAPPDLLLARLPSQSIEWHVSSVHREGTQRLRDWLAARRRSDRVHLLSHRELPITLRVESPERVGIDRLAAAVAANVMREPAHAAIVVGSGTAVTVNLLHADGAFVGGAILPGFRMQAHALFGADQLPLTDFAPDEAPAPLGKNTDEAIRSGLFWGTVGAVRELLVRLREPIAQPVDVFVTGGDVRRLAGALGSDVRFVPNMVLAGVAIAAQQPRQ